jgi:methylene-tetrahydromethanopterin dehydrogenase
MNKSVEKVSILHLITAAKNASPFDVNMAYDAGFDKIMPYTNVELAEVDALTQDAIFSRSASGVKREALFFGGREIHLALDMQNAAKSAMFAPFEISTMADPSGAFTTAAAMLAKVEKVVSTLQNQTVIIFGAGPVGSTAALIAAAQGATVQMAAHRNVASMQTYCDKMYQQFGVTLQAVDASTDAAKNAALYKADIALCTGPAGVQILEKTHFESALMLKVLADVNAVAPLGVAGLGVMANGEQLGNGMVGFGALSIGQLKYQTQHHMLKSLIGAEKPLHLAYKQAFEVARSLL